MAGKHRKIYESYHGPIGKDADGRSLEVHHINGNHSDNRIENLTLVTIQEHYNIHYSQHDWGACLLMSDRMKLTPTEISAISSRQARERVLQGIHQWQLRPDGTSVNSDMVKNGTHPFLGSEVAKKRNEKRIKAGTHNWIKRPDGTSFTGDLVEAGKHHFVTNNPINSLLASGTHAAKIRIACVKCHSETTKNLFERQHKDCFK